MRRALTALVLAPVLAAPAPALAGHASARLASCTTGEDREDRAATFRASMGAVDGAVVLAMRFTLQRRSGDRWVAVAAPTFDRWERSRPGAPRFTFTKAVDGLYAGAVFRARVRFAWRDGQGRSVRSATRWTAACAQALHSTQP